MSRGPGKIDRVIAEMVQKPVPGMPLWVGVVTVAREVYGTDKPTRAQRVSIQRAMHAFIVRHDDAYILDGGSGRTPLGIMQKRERERLCGSDPLALAFRPITGVLLEILRAEGGPVFSRQWLPSSSRPCSRFPVMASDPRLEAPRSRRH